MKNYIKNHKRFVITISILITIIIATNLFLIINRINDKSTIKLENIINKSFSFEVKENDTLTKTKITFNNNYIGTKELTINDNVITYSFKYSIEDNEEEGQVILLDNNGQYEMYSYKDNCIIDTNLKEFIYCSK